MVNKLIFLYLLASLITVQAFAQTENKKYWEDGPLTWKDFKVKGNTVRGGSELRYTLGYETVKYKQQDTLFHRILVSAFVNTEESWVTDGQQSEQALRYHQVIFDIVELYRRQMQETVDRAAISWLAETELRQLSHNSQERIAKMRYETNNGAALSELEAWEQTIQDELQNLPALKHPVVRKRPLDYGLHAGFASNSFSGDLKSFIKPAYGINYGFDLSYNKVALFLKGNLANTKLLQAYLERPKWEENQRMGYTQIEATVGYPILDRARHKITPHFGLAITSLSRHTKVKEEQGDAISNASLVLGINYDLTLRHVVKLVPNIYGIKEGTETNISSRLSVARINYAPNLQGYTLNFTISLMTGYMLQPY